MVQPAQPCQGGSKAAASAVVEALRRHLDACVEQHGLDPTRLHVLRRILSCRTGALGVHLCVCGECGWKGLAPNSCRDRHCPQCQGRQTHAWLEGRLAKMLPVPHFQVVFTLPAELRAVARANQKVVYGLLFRVGASILQDLAEQRMQARMGLTGVLHTWTTQLTYHPHVHFLVTGGGLAMEDKRWVPSRPDYLFPGRILGTMFRGRFLDHLIEAVQADEVQLPGDDPVAAAKAFRKTVRRLAKRHTRWVVHVEPPKDRPVEHALKYLARYVKRVAIADARIIAVTDTKVAFKSRKGVADLDGAEFVRRFALHILPSGFHKVRHYGLYAPANTHTRLPLARSLCLADEDEGELQGASEAADPEAADSVQVERCPACGAAAVFRAYITPKDQVRLLAELGPPIAPRSRGSP